jgi:hypothetical protein
MPSATYFRRRAKACWLLAQIEDEPAESRRYRAMALDCMTKAHELELDEFQLRIMPILREWSPGKTSGKKTKAASVGWPYRR